MISICHVLDTNPYGREYQDILSTLSKFGNIFNDIALKHIYRESWLQVFDCLDYDFSVFGKRLLKYPKFEQFIGYDIILFEQNLGEFIGNAFKKLALNFYYDLLKYKIIERDSFYMLNKLGTDYIVVCKLKSGEFDDTV